MEVAAASTILAQASWIDPSDLLTVTLWGCVFAWLFWMGGSVGSFMNVVVYRLPADINLVYPGSRCPRCLHPIRWYHNLPIAGWLLLRGRCRDCGTKISARYPLVEAFVASLFVLFAAVEVLGEGVNLPARNMTAEATGRAGPNEPASRVRANGAGAAGVLRQRLPHPLADTPERAWGMYAFHLLLLCTLVCAALIEYDGAAVPWQLFLPALVVGFIAPLAWPELHPMPLSPVFGSEPWATGLAEGSAGLVMGALLGSVAWLPDYRLNYHSARVRNPSRATATPSFAPSTARWVFPPSICGLFLGWQAAVVITPLAAALWMFISFLPRPASSTRRIGWAVCITAAAFLFLLAWAPLGAVSHWMPPLAAISLLATFALSSVAALQTPPYTKPLASFGDAPVPDPQKNLEAILNSPTYRLAELDTELLSRPELRPVRMQLELLKPQMALEEQNIISTIVAFGGTAIVERPEAERRLTAAREALTQSPDDQNLQRVVQRAERILAKAHYYDEAREFGRLVSSSCQLEGRCDYVIITGGGPGIMEAANRGAFDVGAKSIGLNITLPAEQAPNPYITPELCFQFHYFALRKMHFLLRAKALVVFPGGFGTLDELTDALTLRQTERMQVIPIIMYGRDYWQRVIDFQFLADEGVIADAHLNLVHYADTPQEAWNLIATFHNHSPEQRGAAS